MSGNREDQSSEFEVLRAEIQTLRAQLAEIRELLSCSVIRPRTSYLDNAHRDRIIYVLRHYLEYPFNEICRILPLFYDEWRFSPKTVSQAFYRYREALPDDE